MHCANSVLIRRTKGIVGTRGRNAAPQPLIIIIIKMKFIIINVISLIMIIINMIIMMMIIIINMIVMIIGNIKIKIFCTTISTRLMCICVLYKKTEHTDLEMSGKSFSRQHFIL